MLTEGAPSLVDRVARRLRYEANCARSRINYAVPGLRSLQWRPDPAYTLWGAQSTPPGNPEALPWSSPSARAQWQDTRCSSLVEDVLNHRWAVLSEEPLNLSAPDGRPPRLLREYASELPAHAVDRYRPILWHRDFKTGHEWNPQLFYRSAALAPRAGADVKVPWELSRFHQVGALARGDLEQGGTEFVLQVLDWIAANPTWSGVNWTSELIVSGRVINWIWGLRLFEPVVRRYPNAVRRIIRSIYEHRRYLERNLAYYIERTDDHYLGNVVALLYVSAAFPELPRSDRWCLFALQELVSEMERQVQVDGFSHMMSSHYHRFVCELFASGAAIAERLPVTRRRALATVDVTGHRITPSLAAANTLPLDYSGSGRLLPRSFWERLAQMTGVTAALTKPNGLVPQLGDNDSARAHKLMPFPDDDSRDHTGVLAAAGELLGVEFAVQAEAARSAEGRLIAGGIGNPPPDLSGAQIPTGERIYLPSSRIAICKDNDVFLVVTCGPNGYGGTGGHGHNDKLSFELNVRGADFIVDGGCPVYTSDPEMRNRYRSTEAHSTIHVTGREQDTFPPGPSGLFRLPERSHPELWVEAESDVVGRHTGFGIPHMRRFRLGPGALVIWDEFNYPCERFLNFNLDSAVTINYCEPTVDGIAFMLAHDCGIAIRGRVKGVSHAFEESGCHSVGYGIPRANRRLKCALASAHAETVLNWDMQ
jgi:hypothetical protein